MSDEVGKLNPDAGPSVAHDFGCTHDPCVCVVRPDPTRVEYGLFRLGTLDGARAIIWLFALGCLVCIGLMIAIAVH